MTDSPYRRQEGGRRNMPQARSGDTNSVREATNYRSFTQKRCYICNSANHLAHQCKAPRTKSTGKSQKSSVATAAKQVTTHNYGIGDDAVNPIDLLLSDPDDDGVFQVRITDRRYIEVEVYAGNWISSSSSFASEVPLRMSHWLPGSLPSQSPPLLLHQSL